MLLFLEIFLSSITKTPIKLNQKSTIICLPFVLLQMSDACFYVFQLVLFFS